MRKANTEEVDKRSRELFDEFKAHFAEVTEHLKREGVAKAEDHVQRIQFGWLVQKLAGIQVSIENLAEILSAE